MNVPRTPTSASQTWPFSAQAASGLLRKLLVKRIAAPLGLAGALLGTAAILPPVLTRGGPAEPSAFAARQMLREPERQTGEGQNSPSLVRELKLGEDALCLMVFAPDGKTLVTGGNSGRICLWDSATGKEKGCLKTPPKPNPNFKALSLSPDGKTLAAGYGPWWDHVSVRVWDVATGEIKRELRLSDHAVSAVTFSPDGKTLAFAEVRGKIYLWDASKEGNLRHVDTEPPYVPFDQCRLIFSPDGKTLAAAIASVMTWDVSTGKRVKLLDAHVPLDMRVTRVVFSHDGRTLFGSGAFYRPVRPGSRHLEWLPVFYFWDLVTGRERRLIQWHTLGNFSELLLSPNGRTLITQLSCRIGFWEMASGKERLFLEAHRPLDFAVALSPDGRTLATSWGHGVVRIWDTLNLPPNDGRGSTVKSAPKGLDGQWADLASADAAQAYRAICTLVHLPKEAVPFLNERLPRLPQADAWTITRLVTDLDSNRFAERKKATDELEKLGRQTQGALEKFLAGPCSLEARRRAQGLLDKIDLPTTSPDRLRVIRSVEVLEKIGNAEAKRLLESLAKGIPGAELTEEAKAALARLSRPSPAKP